MNSRTPYLSTLCFSTCEFRRATREFLLDGSPRRIEPRVFDLLEYLIDHRDRVVSRKELLLAVWKTEHVSESVISRCVMKARRAIGDTDGAAPLIKTLHGSGYRFVGDVNGVEERAAEVGSGPASGDHLLRVAVLPFRNRTGDPELVWIELGLPAFVSRTLESEAGIVVVPITETLAALDKHFEHLPTAVSVAAVQERLNAGAVVAFDVFHDELYQLDCSLYRVSQPMNASSSRGSSLTRLAIDAGQQLAARLSTIERAESSSPFDGDSFMAEAYARGMQAVEEQRFKVALSFLEVCVATEPHPLEIDVEYVTRLAAVSHADTLEKAAELERMVRRAGRPTLLARLWAARSTYHFQTADLASARHDVDAALAELEGESAWELTATLLLQRIEIAVAERDFGAARPLIDRVLRATGRIGSDRLQALGLRQLGAIEQMSGNIGAAVSMLRRSAQLSRSLGLRNADLAVTLVKLALMHKDAGQLGEAMQTIDEAVECAWNAGMAAPAAHALSVQAAVCIHAGEKHSAIAAVERMRSRFISGNKAGEALMRMACGWLEWRVGRFEAALLHFEAANPVVRSFGQYWYNFAVGLNAALCLMAGRLEQAQAFIAEIENHPAYRGDAALQGWALYHRAALWLALGDRARTWQALHASLALCPPGHALSHACLSAAWLGCEDGLLGAAASWLDRVSGWTEEHPCGLMALARYRFECADFEGAVNLQQRYVDGWPADEITPFQQTLLQLYRQSAAANKAMPIPKLGHLLTLRY